MRAQISSEQQRERMLHTPIFRLIAAMAVPTLITQMISVFYNTADTFFVSKISTSASAAVAWCFPSCPSFRHLDLASAWDAVL